MPLGGPDEVCLQWVGNGWRWPIEDGEKADVDTMLIRPVSPHPTLKTEPYYPGLRKSQYQLRSRRSKKLSITFELKACC